MVTHHGHTITEHVQTWSAIKTILPWSTSCRGRLPTEHSWLNDPSEVKDTFKLIQKSHYFFWFFLMSVANEVFFYWPSLGRFSRRIRKTTRGQKKIWIVIVRYLKVIPFCTGRIKRGNFGPFVVLILLTASLIILSGWKNVFLEIRLSPIAQDDIWSGNRPFDVVLRWNENGDPPPPPPPPRLPLPPPWITKFS